MRIYLKGYYGYKNFGDEILIFGVIEKIFRDYDVEHLVIEVGDAKWMQERVRRNKAFLSAYYKYVCINIDREKITFFSLDERSAKKLPPYLCGKYWNKMLSYFLVALGKTPYHQYYKIFGGGEVIDEERKFPHNGRNIVLLYFSAILKRKFEIRGGFGSQKKRYTRILSKFLLSHAERVLARDRDSYAYAKQGNTSTFKINDFSKSIFEFFATHYASSKKEVVSYEVLNLSQGVNTIQTCSIPLLSEKKIYFFPADINIDTIVYFPDLQGKVKEYHRWNFTLLEILNFLKNANCISAIRLHLLYSAKILQVPYVVLYKSIKIKRNLNEVL